MRRPPSDLRGPVMSRPLLETTVRRRVAVLANASVRNGTAAEGIELDAGRVTAVRLNDGSTVPSALVVDATGRQARTLAWLEAEGFPAPETSIVTVDTRYVTRSYRRTADPSRNWVAAAVIDEPETKRLAMALPVEGDRGSCSSAGSTGRSRRSRSPSDWRTPARSRPR